MKEVTGWEKVRLGDVAEITAGQSPQSKFYSTTEGTPFLQGNRTFGLKYPTIDTYTTNITKIAKKGSILMSVRAPVGDLNFAPFDVCIGRGLASLESKIGTNQSLWYILKFNLKNILRQKNLGTTFDAVSKETLQEMKIILPTSRHTQEKIARILSALDEQIELNSRINATLENLARALYTRYFVEFNFPNSQGRPYKASGGAMRYEPTLKRDIPTTWQVEKLADRLDFERGVEFGASSYAESKLSERYIKFYRVGDMLDEKCVYIDSSKEIAPLVNENDLLVSFDGSVGRVAYGLNGTYSSGIRKITDKNNILNQAMLFCIFKDPYIQYTIRQYATGTNIKHAGAAIENLYLPYCENIFVEFQEKITNIFAQMKQSKAQSHKLAQLRDFLLPLLMNRQAQAI